jgi:ubiquinone/menaquinone biosynthesis C-methylase UbiE
MKAAGGLRNQRVLELGCGAGLIAAGVALCYEPQSIHGVDLKLPNTLQAVLSELGLAMPNNLMLSRRESLTDLPDMSFDFVYSWSALHHLQSRVLGEIIEAIYRATAIGGRVLVQAQKFYYSADGGRLNECGMPPWSHLTLPRNELRDRLFQLHGENSATAIAALDRVDNMPRLSSASLASMFVDAGFHLVQRYTTTVADQPPESLRNVFRDEALTENQVILLFSKN